MCITLPSGESGSQAAGEGNPVYWTLSLVSCEVSLRSRVRPSPREVV